MGIANNLAPGVGERAVESVEVDLEEVAVLEEAFPVGGRAGHTERRKLRFFTVVGRLAISPEDAPEVVDLGAELAGLDRLEDGSHRVHRRAVGGHGVRKGRDLGGKYRGDAFWGHFS